MTSWIHELTYRGYIVSNVSFHRGSKAAWDEQANGASREPLLAQTSLFGQTLPGGNGGCLPDNAD